MCPPETPLKYSNMLSIGWQNWLGVGQCNQCYCFDSQIATVNLNIVSVIWQFIALTNREEKGNAKYRNPLIFNISGVNIFNKLPAPSNHVWPVIHRLAISLPFYSKGTFQSMFLSHKRNIFLDLASMTGGRQGFSLMAGVTLLFQLGFAVMPRVSSCFCSQQGSNQYQGGESLR